MLNGYKLDVGLGVDIGCNLWVEIEVVGLLYNGGVYCGLFYIWLICISVCFGLGVPSLMQQIKMCDFFVFIGTCAC